MILNIKNAKRKQEILLRKVIPWAAKELMGARIAKNLEIHVTFTPKFDSFGMCTWEDDNIRPREFSIELKKEQDDINLLMTVCHEMIHVKQMAKSELKEIFKGGQRQVWHGKSFYKEDLQKIEYGEEPWEIEAYRDQIPLAKKYVQSHGYKI